MLGYYGVSHGIGKLAGVSAGVLGYAGVIDWMALGEMINVYQVTGFLRTMVGGISVSLGRPDRDAPPHLTGG